jgi:hypothetical protein
MKTKKLGGKKLSNQKDVKNEGRSDYVYENTVSSDKKTVAKSQVFAL